MVPPPTPHGINYDASFEPTDNNNKRKMRPPPPQAPPINFTPTSKTPDGFVNPPRDPKLVQTLALNNLRSESKFSAGYLNYLKKSFNPSQLEAISAASSNYGDGGFTLVKGPPGTGKTTVLKGITNSLHLRQMSKFYNIIEQMVKSPGGNLHEAIKHKPRILICAPSNAAVDNILQKLFSEGEPEPRAERSGAKPLARSIEYTN